MVHLGMTVKTQRDRVVDLAGALLPCTGDVVDLHLDPAVSVTHAAAPVATNKKGFDFPLAEFTTRHSVSRSVQPDTAISQCR